LSDRRYRKECSLGGGWNGGREKKRCREDTRKTCSRDSKRDEKVHVHDAVQYVDKSESGPGSKRSSRLVIHRYAQH
jgi:hypothetical protein